MALPTTAQVQTLLDQLAHSWSVGSGPEFGASFTDDAHFVAFDGTVLLGSAAIAKYHQAAFDRYLKDTVLVTSVDGTCDIGESALLVFTSGGIQSKSGDAVVLTGASVQTIVVVVKNNGAIVQAFQNTRQRPITDEGSAHVWKEFDKAWSGLAGRRQA